MTTKSQNAQIINHLKKGKTITPLQALQMFGCFRLSARIYNLTRGQYDGTRYNIVRLPKRENFATYKLIKN